MPEFILVVITHDWERFDEVLDLSYDVLYRDFGVPRDGDWYQPAHGSEFAVALADDGMLLGTARLLPAAGDESRQVRQVAVDPDARVGGVGRALMDRLEAIAAGEGARELWLQARDNAWGFYERLGYTAEGDVFESGLTGIAHRTMRKSLG